MPSVKQFEDFIIPYAPDAPAVMVQHAIREATVRFLRSTRVLTDKYCLTSQCGVRDYVIEMPDCQRLIAIEAVYSDNGFGPSIPGFRGLPPDWVWNKDDRFPVVELSFSPREGTVYQVEYSWTIPRDGCDVPEEVYEEWEPAIKYGALFELLMMPDQEWSQPGLAQYFDEKFRAECSDAKSRKWHNYTQGALQFAAPEPFLGNPRFL